MTPDTKPIVLTHAEHDEIIDALIDAMTALQRIETEARESREALEGLSTKLSR